MLCPREVYRLENLRRAWQWIRSNADRQYKWYFAELYTAYSIADDALLNRLSNRLRHGAYEPEPACKVFLPKKSGLLRPYSLLCVDDQIAYQAVLNIVAEALVRRVRHRYYKNVFGHLYAGKGSTWFYQRWSNGYAAFNRTIKKGFNEGLRFAATFDLTACYDSIDHRVLQHFLTDLGVSRELSECLCQWLAAWTATDHKILHGHGIPQGPLSSGLLAEAVLRHFDDNHAPSAGTLYVRYVDDIRLLARTEGELRKAIYRLDRLSKDIGLFPQASKIDIHEVADIRAELKTVSRPPESARRADAVADQSRVHARLIALSPRLRVSDATRFKYVLAQCQPAATVSARLWKVYRRHPEFYEAIARYLARADRLPRRTSEELVRAIAEQELYESIAATFLWAARARLADRVVSIAKRKLKKFWTPRAGQADRIAQLGRWLISVNHFTERQLEYAVTRCEPGWIRAQLMFQFRDHSGSAALVRRLLCAGIRDQNDDAAMTAAYIMGVSGIYPGESISRAHEVARLVLKEFGMVGPRGSSSGAACRFAASLRKLLGTETEIHWRRFLGKEYDNAHRQIVECRGYAETNATAWVNALDVFNDYLPPVPM